MTQKKTETSDRERERRAKQAAQQQQGRGGPPGQAQGKAQQSGYHPSNAATKPIKDSGRAK